MNNNDNYIRKKMQEDNFIPEKVNKVFENFSINNINENSNNENIQKQNVVSFFTYKNLNKFLSVAAVFLCVVLVGMGTLVKNKSIEVENINIVTNAVYIKNKEITFSNEEVRSTSENSLIKVSIVGDRTIAIQLKDKFIKTYNLNLDSSKQYETVSQHKNIKDVFVGCIVSENTPYVMLIMEDNTVEYIEILYDVNSNIKYGFNFFIQGNVVGLSNVVSFEQGSRKYTNKEGIYYYINAIRQDGKKREIDIWNYNDWDDPTTYTYNKLNVNNELENNNEKEEINNNENEIIENNQYLNDERYYKCSLGKICLKSKLDKNSAYYIENNNLYRNNISEDTYTHIAEGVDSIEFDKENNIIVQLKQEYSIYLNDNNVFFEEYDVVANEYTLVQNDDKFYVFRGNDGSIVIQIVQGGLQRLGLEGKTTLKENVRYNVVGINVGVQNNSNGNIYANAITTMLGEVGPNKILCLTYVTLDGQIISIDIKNAIESNSFKGGTTTTAILTKDKEFTGLGRKLIEEKYEDGEKIEEYETIVVKYIQDGEQKYQEVVCLQ